LLLTLVVHPRSLFSTTSIHQIFFDDNIKESDAYIVDARRYVASLVAESEEHTLAGN
jgi:hypothetical protein